MKLNFGAATDVGRVRDHNEDNFLIDKNLNLFIVCDGMGGHAAGEVASAMTVNITRDDIAANRELLAAYAEGDERVGRRDVLAVLEHAVQHACYQVYERAQQKSENRGMGTTVVLMVVIGTRGFIAHVGDSRIYLVRQQQVHQLTEDHSLVNELMKQGRIQVGSGVPQRYKNAVTRAVGVYESVEVDTLDFDILPGDRFLLCTDGLHGYFTNERVLRLMQPDDDDAVVKDMIRFANERGGKDNITAVVVTVSESDQDAQHDRVRRKLATLKSLTLFKYLNYQELVKVVNIAAEKIFKKGQVIFNEGDNEDCLYVILTGSVSIRKQGVEVARLGEGTHFGEMALVERAPRSADAVADSEVHALTVSRRSFYDVLRKNPSLAVKLLWSFLKVMSTRLRSTSDELTVAKSVGSGSRPSGDGADEDVLPSDWLEDDALVAVVDVDEDAPAAPPAAVPGASGSAPATPPEGPALPTDIADDHWPTGPGATPPATPPATADTHDTIPSMPAFTDIDDGEGAEPESEATRTHRDTIPNMNPLALHPSDEDAAGVGGDDEG